MAIVLATLANLAGAAPTKYSSAGYSSYYSSGFDAPAGCEYLHGGGTLDFYIYGSQGKFQTSGKDGYKESSTYEDMYAYLDIVTSCDGNSVEYLSGAAAIGYYNVAPKFGLDAKKLSNAWVAAMVVPLSRYTCTQACYETCYPELFEYGTCPETEEAYIECYYSDCTQEDAGIAEIDIEWTATTASSQSSSSSSYKDPRSGFTYSYKNKGTSRDASATVSALVDGVSVFVSEPSYSYGSIWSTTNVETYKTK